MRDIQIRNHLKDLKKITSTMVGVIFYIKIMMISGTTRSLRSIGSTTGIKGWYMSTGVTESANFVDKEHKE